jgi:dTDP-4-dehydrorhamnose reductase
MKIWLLGARGMLGTVLLERLSRLDVATVTSDLELDIADAERVLAFARGERPTLIVNAAAYTRVDDAETHEADAFRANGEGPGNLGAAAASVGARVLHFSTDYVFDGQGSEPYREDAPTAPRGVYARSKLQGEQRLLAACPEGATVVRTSWLFGPNGPSFVRTMTQLLAQKEELRVVDDQRGRPTYTVDLADAALSLVGLGHAGAPPGVYHFANAGAVTWHAFTLAIRDACVRRGLPVKTERILPVTTAEFPRPAPRPAYSVLDTTRVEQALASAPRPFQATLDDYYEYEETRPRGG